MRPMKKFYVLLIIIITFNKIRATPNKLSNQDYLTEDLSHLLQKLFLTKETLQLIYEDFSDHDPLPTINNPCIVTKIDKAIKNGLNAYNNYIIFSNNQTSFNKTLSKFKHSCLWDQTRSPRGRFVVVTSSCMNIKTLANNFHDYGIVNFSLIQKSSSHENKKSFIVDFSTQNNSYQIHYVAIPEIKVHAIKMILPFFINISTTDNIQLKAIFELAVNSLSIIGKILKIETFYVLTNNTKNLIYKESDDMYIYLSTTRDEQLYKDYDVSTYFYRDIIVWIVPIPDEISTIKTIITTLDLNVWLIIITILIVESVLCWLFSKLFKGQFVNFIICILTSFTIALGGSSYLIPKTNALRILLLFYIFYSMQISTIFQGKLFSGLTQPGKEHGITTMKELIESPIPMIGSKKSEDFTLEYFSNHSMFSKILKKLIVQNPLDLKGSLENIVRFKNCSTIMGKAALYKVYPQFKPRVNLIEHNTGNFDFEMTLAIRKGHYLLNTLNKFIRRMIESGIYIKLFSDATISCRNNETEDEARTVVLGIYRLNGLFILWAVGLLLAVSMFVAELFTYHSLKMKIY